jgi:hypothetical protein
VLAPLLFEGSSSNVRIVAARTRREGETFRTEVRARRTGEVALPTWLAAFDETGKELTRVPWAPETESLHVDLETRTEVSRVVVDPDRSLLIDSDTRDQVRVLTSPDRSAWLSRIIAVGQALLSWVGP